MLIPCNFRLRPTSVMVASGFVFLIRSSLPLSGIVNVTRVLLVAVGITSWPINPLLEQEHLSFNNNPKAPDKRLSSELLATFLCIIPSIKELFIKAAAAPIKTEPTTSTLKRA